MVVFIINKPKFVGLRFTWESITANNFPEGTRSESVYNIYSLLENCTNIIGAPEKLK